MRRTTLAVAIVLAVGVSALHWATRLGEGGSVERILVHGRSLEGNLAGDSADRPISVYLPPSYATAQTRRYPVLYLLHGFTDDDNRWFGRLKHFIDVPAAMNRSAARPGSHELIVVMPNAYTRFQGSMYSRSVTTGDWETFVANELVAFVDARYRTLPTAASRGIAGHSMGGYGALRFAMKYPTIFSAAYALSPCCILPPGDSERTALAARAEAVHTFEEFERADFATKLQLAGSAAWSPNAKRPPLFLDLLTINGETQTSVAAKWAANALPAIAEASVDGLRQLKGIAFDVGDQDAGIAETLGALDRKLKTLGIPHTFETYEGDHVSRIGERFETRVLPFFWAHLAI